MTIGNGNSQNGSSENKQDNKQDWLSALMKLPRTKGAMLVSAGEMLSDYAFKQQKQHLSNLHPDFDSLDTGALGKGAGRLIAAWLVYQEGPTVQDLSSRLNRIAELVEALDATSETPIERAMARFIASKMALVFEGYTSKTGVKTATYQRYQEEAKLLLKAFSNRPGLSRKDIYLGTPFSSQALFIAAHRFLTQAQLSSEHHDLQAFLLAWQTRSLREVSDYYAQLLALTHKQTDSALLTDSLARWFESYRTFLLGSVQKKEKWVKFGLDTLGGNVSLFSLLGKSKK